MACTSGTLYIHHMYNRNTLGNHELNQSINLSKHVSQANQQVDVLINKQEKTLFVHQTIQCETVLQCAKMDFGNKFTNAVICSIPLLHGSGGGGGSISPSRHTYERTLVTELYTPFPKSVPDSRFEQDMGGGNFFLRNGIWNLALKTH